MFNPFAGQKFALFPLVDFAAMNVLCEAERHYDVAETATHLCLFYSPKGDTIQIHIYYPICESCTKKMMEMGVKDEHSGGMGEGDKPI